MENKKPVLRLVGFSSNAFAILMKARKVAEKNKLDWQTIEKEATSGDYDKLLSTMTKYFTVR